MRLSNKLAKVSALAMILALPLLLAGCGPQKPPIAPPPDTTGPIDQTNGTTTGLTPSEESTDTGRFDTGPQTDGQIKTNDDVEKVLNSPQAGDKSDQINSINDSDINNFK